MPAFSPETSVGAAMSVMLRADHCSTVTVVKLAEPRRLALHLRDIGIVTLDSVIRKPRSGVWGPC